MKLFRFIAILVLLIPAGRAFAQLAEGEIIYEEIMHWSRIASRLDFLSQEEKDRMKLTWANWDEEKIDKKLVFNGQASLYTFASKQREYADGKYTQKNPEYTMYRDFVKNRQSDWIEMLGRVYHIEDSIRAPKWKIMNKIKDIQGHICMMAVTEDTVKKQSITAWFADDIPVSVGPGFYFGLPGAILELEINDGDVVISAKKIELKPVGDEIQPSRKLKGRKIDLKAYDTLLSKHFSDSMKSRRNPYWSLPF